jgi:hypothetical protein
MSVINRTDTTNARATRNDIFPPATTARYVRISFVESSPPPALAEVELQGVIAR